MVNTKVKVRNTACLGSMLDATTRVFEAPSMEEGRQCMTSAHSNVGLPSP